MSIPKTFHGGRAVIKIKGLTVGMFSSFGYGLSYDLTPINILGRMSAAELVYTGQEPVRCNATGWRSIGNGPHTGPAVPHLQDLLIHESVDIEVYDRQAAAGSRPMAIIRDVRPESYQSTISVKSPTEVTISFIGLLVDDESGSNHEAAMAADLP